MDGWNKSTLKSLQKKGEELVTILNDDQPNDKFLEESLDEYLKMAAQAQVEHEVEQERIQRKEQHFGCTEKCVKENEILEDNVKRYQEVLKNLHQFEWGPMKKTEEVSFYII